MRMFPQIATVIPTTVDVSSSGILPLKSNAQKDEDADMDDNEEEAIQDGPNIPEEWEQPRAFVYYYHQDACSAYTAQLPVFSSLFVVVHFG